jgi:uncharacterized Tic20 family protein
MIDPLPSSAAIPALPSKEERTWALVVHLSAFAGHIFPFAHIVVPLVVWLGKRETSAFVDDQGKEAVNAQISFTIYICVCVVLCFLLIGLPMLIGVYVANFIFVIVAAIAANDGRAYRYPCILRLVK